MKDDIQTCETCAMSAELKPRKADMVICRMRLTNTPRESRCGEYEKKTKKKPLKGIK